MLMSWLRNNFHINSIRPGQNGCHFADTFKRFFQGENVWISIKISLKFVPKAPINNIPSLVQIMAWCRPGDKPLSEPMMVSLLTHICVTRPQWVNAHCEGNQAALEVSQCQSHNKFSNFLSWTWGLRSISYTITWYSLNAILIIQWFVKWRPFCPKVSPRGRWVKEFQNCPYLWIWLAGSCYWMSLFLWFRILY